MVSLSQRMRKLQTQLLAIRLGSGALVLPKDVKRVHLRFHQFQKGGHMGPRYEVAKCDCNMHMLSSRQEILAT